MEALITHKLFIFLIDAVGLYLAYLVYFKNRKPFLNKVFALMMVCMILWADFAYFARIAESTEISMSFLKIAWFVSPLPFF